LYNLLAAQRIASPTREDTAPTVSFIPLTVELPRANAAVPDVLASPHTASPVRDDVSPDASFKSHTVLPARADATAHHIELLPPVVAQTQPAAAVHRGALQLWRV